MQNKNGGVSLALVSFTVLVYELYTIEVVLNKKGCM